MTKIDKEKQIVTLKNGQQIEYGALITTTPLDLTLQWLGKKDIADRLEHRCLAPFIAAVTIAWRTWTALCSTPDMKSCLLHYFSLSANRVNGCELSFGHLVLGIYDHLCCLFPTCHILPFLSKLYTWPRCPLLATLGMAEP